MKQKLLILLFAIMAIVGSYAGPFDNRFAYDYNGVTLVFDLTSSSTCEFVGCLGGDVVIPEVVVYNGSNYSVTGIALYANFDNRDDLTSITIPNTVTYIEDGAFRGCNGLTAFYGKFASNDNRCLIVDGVLKCFAPSGLSEYSIPNSVTTIGRFAFSLYTGLTSVEIGNSVTTIGSSAFSQCTGLTSVEIGNSVTTIGSSAFNNCSGLTSITIPNSVTSIGDYTFNDCSGLTSVEIGNSVTTIGSYAFSYCSGLTSVTIPNSVTYIDGYAFCFSGLTSVNIGNSVTSIGENGFWFCRNLTSVTVNNDNPANLSLGNEWVFYGSDETTTLYVPQGSKELYAAANVWKDFNNIVEFGPISLTDSDAYTASDDQNDVDIEYTRTFAADIWQPLYVPFNMSYDEWKDYGRVAELSCVHAYDDGRTTIEFVSVNDGELLPNVPYVFLPYNGGEVTFNCTGKILKAAPEEGSKYIMCSSPRYTFKIFGNYQPISGSTLATYGDPQFNGAYVMTNENKFQHCSPSSTLKPYRFYITREKSANGYWGAPNRQNAPTDVDEDNDVIYFMVDGQICSIADIVFDGDDSGAIYDLMGREVKNPSNGIYIQNGKKTRIY